MLLCSLAAVLPILAQSQTATTITLDPANLGRTIPSTFEGISIEMYSVVDLGTTTYPSTNSPANVPADAWFNSGSSTIGTLMNTLGIKSLRIGGTTTEVPTDLNANATYPPLYDEEYVAAFAQQWGLQMIWAIPAAADYNLSTYETYVANAISAQKTNSQTFPFIVEMGNEPDNEGVGTATYVARFNNYLGAFRSDISTSIQVLGPSELGTSYTSALMSNSEYDSSSAPWHSNIAYVTHHLYPFGCASGQSSVNGAIETMLGNNASTYASDFNSFAATATSYGYGTRIDELNSFCGGGYSGASNAFAAALWGLDVLEYYSHNTTLSGMNFHEGTTGTASYAPFMPQYLSSTYTVQGLGYGMLAFNEDGMGQVVPTTISGAGSSLNITAYGTYMSNKSETLVVINKTSVIAGTDTNVTLTVVPGAAYTTATVYFLKQTNNDPTATTGMTFGGAAVSTAGTWSGTPTTYTVNSNGTFTIPLSYSEAAVINMSGGTEIINPGLTVGSYTELINDKSGLCLSAVNTTEGTQLEQVTCSSSTLLEWELSTEGSGYYITNQDTGMVVDDSGQSKTSGGAVIDWDKNAGTNQEWTFTSNGNGYYTITNVYSGLCLDVAGASTSSGALIEQVTCNGASDQLWKQ